MFSSLNSLSMAKRRVFVVLIIVAALILSLVIPRYITISISNSLRYRLFYTKKHPDSIEGGDYVVFVHDVVGTKYRNINMIKRVGCDEGEELTVDGQRRFFCNGNYLGTAKEKLITLPNQKHFVWNGAVPAGRFLPFGDHKDSFDGRYYGFVEKKLVDAKAIPII